MKTYSWRCGLGIRYMVFASSIKEAKDFLYKHYDGKDLDRLLFHRKPTITSMPKGCVEMAPMSTVWLPEKTGRKV
jgi:hypothetical protein